MSIKAIIIEDEPLAANLLEQMLADIKLSVQVVDKCGDLPAAVKSIRRNHPNIVFLDIELPVYNGTQLLEFFNEDEIDFDIIFTTAYNDYALKAFEMSAVDYLVKPLQVNKVKNAVQKAIANKRAGQTAAFPILNENMQGNYKKIIVPVEKGHEIIDLDTILYIEAHGAYARIYFKEEKPITASKNLSHFESMLSPVPNFFRVHRTYLVNLNYARKLISVDGWILVMQNKAELSVSQDKKDKVLELLKKL
jgi:two-component system, LytTR family, response regulator